MADKKKPESKEKAVDEILELKRADGSLFCRLSLETEQYGRELVVCWLEFDADNSPSRGITFFHAQISTVRTLHDGSVGLIG